MLSRSLKLLPNSLTHNLRCTSLLKPNLARFQPFCSVPQQNQISVDNKLEDKKLAVDTTASTNIHVKAYMQKLYQYLASASLIGISSTYIVSMATPTGFPLAFMILYGFTLEHFGRDSIEKSRPSAYMYKNSLGNIQYGTTNTPLRKLYFITSCLGYGGIIGAMLSISGVAPSALVLSAVTCVASTMGHLAYCAFAKKSAFKPMDLVFAGICTGMIGLSLASGLGVGLAGFEREMVLGLVLYNMFTGHDSQKAMDDKLNGKGDYLQYASKSADNWLYALIPFLFMSLYSS